MYDSKGFKVTLMHKGERDGGGGAIRPEQTVTHFTEAETEFWPLSLSEPKRVDKSQITFEI